MKSLFNKKHLKKNKIRRYTLNEYLKENIDGKKDAKETNLALKYKINKKLKVAISNAIRTSKFDGYKNKDVTQDYVSMSIVYKF